MNKLNLVLSVNETLFIDMFRKYNRIDNFTFQGLQELFDYLDSLADEMDEPIELDVIGLCCEFYEGNAQDIVNDYKEELSEAISLADEYGQTVDDIVSEWLQDQGLLVSEYDVNGVTHFLYRAF